jgi:hypothetical protein
MSNMGMYNTNHFNRRITDISNSYVEGVVRGYRNALLTGQNYSNLTQCETIDGTRQRTVFLGVASC